MAAFVVLAPRPFSIFAFSHERRKEEEELTIDISPQLGPPTEERRKNNVPKKVKKEFHDSSMANCRGDLFSYLGMGRRINGNDVINLSNCSESLLLLLFLAFSHTKSLIGCWNSRVP
jgi:hypothetical protein